MRRGEAVPEPLYLTMNPLAVSAGLLLAATLGTARAQEPGATERAPATEQQTPPKKPKKVDYAKMFAEVEAGKFDPLTVPRASGIVWYGTWEAAMDEVERTGKPVMLHFGSPRCPKETVCVPGTW